MILQPVTVGERLRNRLCFYVIQALDHCETYHWLNAMSLSIPVIFNAMIEDRSAKSHLRNKFLRLTADLPSYDRAGRSTRSTDVLYD